MNRSDARVFMSHFIDDRVQERAEVVFINERERMEAYERSYRRARGFSEEPPETRRRNTGGFYYGLLSDMPTMEMTARQDTEEITLKRRAVQH